MALWMSKVWLTEALAWKRGVNEQATMPNDIGSKPNLFSTLRIVLDSASSRLHCCGRRSPTLAFVEACLARSARVPRLLQPRCPVV